MKCSQCNDKSEPNFSIVKTAGPLSSRGAYRRDMKNQSIFFWLILLSGYSLVACSPSQVDTESQAAAVEVSDPTQIVEILSEPPHHVSAVNTEAPLYAFRADLQTPLLGDFGPDGKYYVADWLGGRIAIIDSNGVVSGDTGLWRDDPWFGDGPRGVQFDSLGNMVFHSHSSIFSLQTGGLQHFDKASGSPLGSIALDRNDQIYYSDRGMGKIFRILDSGDIELVAEGISNAEGMVFGLDGTLYVGQSFQEKVVAIDVSIGSTRVFLDFQGRSNPDPVYLAVDGDGDIWVRSSAYLAQIDPSGNPLPIIVDGQDISDSLYHSLNPAGGIAFDEMGRLWIGNYNSMIQILEPNETHDQFEITTHSSNFAASDIAVNSNGEIIAYNENSLELVRITGTHEYSVIANLRSGGGRSAIAITPDDKVYWATPLGELLFVLPDGTTQHWADLLSERMISDKEGSLIAVVTEDDSSKSIAIVRGLDEVETIATSTELVNAGATQFGSLHLGLRPDGDFIVYDEEKALAFLLTREGELSIYLDLSQVGIPSGVSTMTVDFEGNLYVISHATIHCTHSQKMAMAKLWQDIFGAIRGGWQ